MKKTATVYWLLPAKPQRELLREIVRILCRELDGPRFEPHLTLFVSKEDRTASAKRQSGSDLRRGGHSPKRILQRFKSGPIRLRIHKVTFGREYTKTLFVRFKPSSALKKLAIDLGKAAHTRASVPSDPHLSLLYKRRITAATEKALAETINLPFREVIFDSIAAVRLNLPVRNRADVARWKIVAKKSLRR